MSKYLKIANSYEGLKDFTAPDMDLKYELDPFQQHGVAAICRGENVLITAKTGSGKTFIGEYQIAHSLAKGRRVFYTTPIKSLSNQKFNDLKNMFGSHRVGIMTGDIKFQPDAPIVIMTTEILRNLLYKQGTVTESLGLSASLSLDDLDAVIFDEVHFINNKERGRVWEETFILLPKEIKLILLSATINNPELFAAWLGELKQKTIWLIPTKHRVVPLTHYVLRNKELVTIMDSSENFIEKAYSDWIKGLEEDRVKERNFKKQVANKNAAGDIGGLEGKFKTTSVKYKINSCIEVLKEKELLPALVFSFSRRDCEKYAAAVEGSLIDSSDAAAVAHIFDFHLKEHKQHLEKLQQFWSIRDLICKGIAFHHSGLLPVLKEVIEIIFSKGYIKVLFCTETFAVGINMPTKTAVFLSFTKHDEDGQRLLYTDEYIQMAGRAGRRGLDKVGTVIYLPDREPVTCLEARRVMKSAMPSISSKMQFGHEFILKTFHLGLTEWRYLIDNSYWYQQRKVTQKQLENEICALDAKAAKIPIDAVVSQELAVRSNLEMRVKMTTNAVRKDAQRELDRWKDKHMGPKWESGWKLWSEWKKLMIEKENIQANIKYMEDTFVNPKTLLDPSIEFLKDIEFLNEDGITLTKLGIMSTEINEAHSILLPLIYFKGYFNNLSTANIVSLLGIFINSNDISEENRLYLNDLQLDKDVITIMRSIAELSEELIKKEYEYIPSAGKEYWQLEYTWSEIGYRWCAGEAVDVLCGEYGIYEGNLMRGIMKMSNMLEELKSLATLSTNVELLNKLDEIKLIRDVAIPDSLYLKL
jgi:superfamily II RNA helicase